VLGGYRLDGARRRGLGVAAVGQDGAAPGLFGEQQRGAAGETGCPRPMRRMRRNPTAVAMTATMRMPIRLVSPADARESSRP